MKKTLIRGGTLIRENGQEKADVLIGVAGIIEKIAPEIHDHQGCDIVEVKDHLLFPLLIDCHVHFREPGLTHKATMESEAASARAGGVGTVCEMPNTIPPTVTVAALADKVRRASHIDGVDLKFFFGITEALHLQALLDLWTGSSLELKKLRHHCCGVKLYLDHSTGNQKVEGGILHDVFQACAKHKIPIVAHCEDSEMNAEKARIYPPDTHTDISLHSLMRPPESEEKSIREAIKLVEETGAALHIAHLSTARGLFAVQEAKKRHSPVTCEVSPHHLFLTTDDYGSLGALGKMNPPLRSSADRDALWDGIMDGSVDAIATDHAPHTLEEKKTENPLKAPSGVPGVETMLPLLLSVASGHWPHGSAPKASKEFSYSDILRLCFTAPKNIFSLTSSAIEEKEHAHIVIVDPSKEWVIRGKELRAACAWTPFEGWKVHGKVVRTIG